MSMEIQVSKDEKSKVNDSFVKNQLVDGSIQEYVRVRFVNGFINNDYSLSHKGIDRLIKIEKRIIDTIVQESNVNNREYIQEKLSKLIDIQYEKFTNMFFEKRKREIFRLNEIMYRLYIERGILTIQVGLRTYNLHPFITVDNTYWFMGELI